MAQAILDRVSNASTPTVEKSPEAIAHDMRMKELYKRFFSAETSDEAVAEDYAATFSARPAAPAEPAAEQVTRAAVQERTAPVRTESFTDYKDHRIAEPEAVAVAPAAEPETEDVTNDEDLLPTRRTMQTLQRIYRAEDTPTMIHKEEHVGFFASLSARTKLVLSIIAAAIVVAIALVCINTGILNSMDARIAARNSELTDLSERYAKIREELDGFHDPNYIDEYAQSSGMIRGEA